MLIALYKGGFMACTCHGKAGNPVRLTMPLDQCALCAKKHFDDAYWCYHEFRYTDANRDHVHRQLRAVVNHTWRRWPETAKRVRDLAEIIIQVRDAELTTEWDDLQQEINANYYRDNPDAAERLKRLREKTSGQ